MTPQETHIFNLLCNFAGNGTPCDICTFSGPVYLDAVFDDRFLLALSYGAGATAIAPLLSALDFTSPSGGGKVSLKDIWILNQMPKGGIPQEELDEVDLSQGDVQAGDAGKTISEIVREVYRTKTDQEHEFYLRRFLAS